MEEKQDQSFYNFLQEMKIKFSDLIDQRKGFLCMKEMGSPKFTI